MHPHSGKKPRRRYPIQTTSISTFWFGRVVAPLREGPTSTWKILCTTCTSFFSYYVSGIEEIFEILLPPPDYIPCWNSPSWPAWWITRIALRKRFYFTTACDILCLAFKDLLAASWVSKSSQSWQNSFFRSIAPFMSDYHHLVWEMPAMTVTTYSIQTHCSSFFQNAGRILPEVGVCSQCNLILCLV